MSKEVRCAIYTRKSDKKGLELTLNSLQAQRIACEKYIENKDGWVVLPKRYDDGDLSGGNLNRKALKELLEDIIAGKIDCVVVYTLDRLSRETKDCIEVTEFFRERGVSFVAVTQVFDNDTPMGKFVQTVLSGAAQLEREMVISRINDKIAISKEEGLWIGGSVPLGYDVKEKKLIINEEEAKVVKEIFERYIEMKSVSKVTKELNKQGYRTKRYEGKSGKVRGEKIFQITTVRGIITNPIYAGKVRHKEKQYKGKHEAIIEEEKWKKAQELMGSRKSYRGKYEEALLKGIIRCQICNVSMLPEYTKKKNKRYRYYVCDNHAEGGNCPSKNRRVPAGEIEKEVMEKIYKYYETKEEERWRQREIVKKLIRTVWMREDGIEICPESKEFEEKIKEKEGETSIFVGMKARKKVGRCIILEPERGCETKKDNTLLKAIVRAHLWKRQLESGKYESTKELSAEINIRHIQRILRLNYLAPKIKEDIINGRQPRNLKLADLKKIPRLWSKQLEKFYG